MKHTLEKRQYEFCQNWSTFGARLIKRTTLQKCQGPLVAVYIDPTEAYYQDSGIGGSLFSTGDGVRYKLLNQPAALII